MENPGCEVNDDRNQSDITSVLKSNKSELLTDPQGSYASDFEVGNSENVGKAHLHGEKADLQKGVVDGPTMTSLAGRQTTAGDIGRRKKRFLNDHPMESEEVLQVLGRIGKYQLLVFFLIGFVTLRGVWHLFGGIFLAADPGHHCHLAFNQATNGSIPIAILDGVETLEKCEMFIPGSQNFTQPCSDGWTYGHSFRSIVVEWDLVCDRSYLSDLSTSVFMAGMIVGSLCLSPLADRFGRKTILLAALWVQGVIGVGTAFVNDLALFMVMRFILGALNQTIGLVGYVLVPEAFPSSNRSMPYVALFLFWSCGIMTFALFGYLVRSWRWLEIIISVPNFLTIVYFWILPESIPWLMAKQKLKQSEIVIRKAAKLNGIDLPPGTLNLATDQTSKALLTKDDKAMSTDQISHPEENGIWKKKNSMEIIHKNSSDGDRAQREANTENSCTNTRMDNDKATKSNIDPQNGLSTNSLADLPVSDKGVKLTSFQKHSNGLQVTNDHSEVVVVKPTSYTIIDLFRTPKMRIYSLIIFYLWLVNSLSYFGISFSVPILHGDIFINLFISGVVEIPAYVLCMATVECFGRRRPLSVFMLVCGVSSVIAVFVPAETESKVDLSPLKTTLAMISKFGITGAYVTVYLFCVEIFPTVVRNLGLGIAAAFETVGAVAAPFIASSAKTIPQLPLTVFGALTIIGGVLCLVLPETHRKRLPETIEEVEGWNKKTGEKNKGR